MVRVVVVFYAAKIIIFSQSRGDMEPDFLVRTQKRASFGQDEFPNNSRAGVDRGHKRLFGHKRFDRLATREELFGVDFGRGPEVESCERMFGNVDVNCHGRFVEVYGHDHYLILINSQKRILVMGVKLRILIVDIHQVEEIALG